MARAPSRRDHVTVFLRCTNSTHISIKHRPYSSKYIFAYSALFEFPQEKSIICSRNSARNPSGVPGTGCQIEVICNFHDTILPCAAYGLFFESHASIINIFTVDSTCDTYSKSQTTSGLAFSCIKWPLFPRALPQQKQTESFLYRLITSEVELQKS